MVGFGKIMVFQDVLTCSVISADVAEELSVHMISGGLCALKTEAADN
jgi:hypothetical protein